MGLFIFDQIVQRLFVADDAVHHVAQTWKVLHRLHFVQIPLKLAQIFIGFGSASLHKIQVFAVAYKRSSCLLFDSLEFLSHFHRVADSGLVSFFDFQIKGLDIIDNGILKPFNFSFDPIDIVDSFLELAQHSHALLLHSNWHFLRRMIHILSIFHCFLKPISQVVLLYLNSIYLLFHLLAVLVLNVYAANMDTHFISIIC